MAIDAVYVVGSVGPLADSALRYSLRSLEQWVPFLGEVTIVGSLPPFVTGVRHIPAESTGKHPQENVNRNLLLAFREGFKEDKVLLMNDDFWLLAPWGPESVYHKGLLREAVKSREGNRENYYYQSLAETERVIGNHDALNFELHCPLPVKKLLFTQILEEHVGEQACILLFRSLYGNSLPSSEIAGQLSDNKCYRHWVNPGASQTFVSSDDFATTSQKARMWFEKTYPNPSRRFERI